MPSWLPTPPTPKLPSFTTNVGSGSSFGKYSPGQVIYKEGQATRKGVKVGKGYQIVADANGKPKLVKKIAAAPTAAPGTPAVGSGQPAAPVDPDANLSPLDKLVKAQLAPQIAAFDKQSAIVTGQAATQAQRATDYYGGLAGQFQGIQDSAKGMAADSATRTKAIGDAAQASIKGAYDTAAAGQSQNATVRGPGLDGGASTALATQMADAQARAGTDAQGQQTLNENTSNSYRGLIDSMKGVGALQGGEAQTKISAATAGSLADIGVEKAKVLASGPALKYQLQSDQDTKSAAAEQQAFTNYITAQTLDATNTNNAQDYEVALAKIKADASQFGQTLDYKNTALDQAKTIADDKNDVTRDVQNQKDATIRNGQTLADKQAENRTDATLRGQTLAHQDRLAKMAADKGGVKGLTASQQVQLKRYNTKIRGGISSANSMLGYYATVKDTKTNKPLSAAQIKAAMLTRFGNDTDIVNAAYDLRKNGYLSPAAQHALEARGIGVPQKWKTRGAAGYSDSKQTG